MAVLDIPLEELEFIDVNGEEATTMIYRDVNKNPIVKWESYELVTPYTIDGLLWYPLLGVIKSDTVSDLYKSFTYSISSSYQDEIGEAFSQHGAYTHFQTTVNERRVSDVYIGSRYSNALGANYTVSISNPSYLEQFAYSPSEGANNYIRWYSSSSFSIEQTNKIWCKYSQNVSSGDITITTPYGTGIPTGGNIGSGDLLTQLQAFDWGTETEFKTLHSSSFESVANDIGTKEGYVIVSFRKLIITEY